MTKQVDLIVIGAGPGGYEIAAHEAAKGKSVIIIEKDKVGGTCLNRGCIPTKCLCAGAERKHLISEASEYGVDAKVFSVSYATAVERAGVVVSQLRDGIETLLAKCEKVEGEAVIHSDGTVSVGEISYRAEKTIIASGSSPASLSIPGAHLAISSDEFLKLESLPEHIIIIGGGVIGLEFAYIANAYGSDVTVVEYCKEILPPFDAELAKRLRMMLSQRGIRFITSAKVKEISDQTDALVVNYEDKKGMQTVLADSVLMAVGRRPVLPRGLAEAGINVSERGFIIVDDAMQTSRSGFYAVGDCNGRMMLAHAATAQAMRAIGEKVNLEVIPSAVFTDPELAMVGLTTEQCKAQGLNYVARKALYRANGKALASGHPDGMVKVLFDHDTRLLLGCHILGAHASDLIAEPTLALAHGLTVDQMAMQTVHSHPTLTEILPSAIF